MNNVFETNAQILIDRWIHSEPGLDDPSPIYSGIVEKLQANMILGVVDTRPATPKEFTIHYVHKYRVPTRLWNNRQIQTDQKLSEFRDQEYIDRAVIPHYLQTLEKRRPVIDFVTTKIFGVNVHYDRLLLPQKRAAGRPSWFVTLTRTRLLLAGNRRDADILERNEDEAVLQLLIEGYAAKEIAATLSLSPKTIEHRLSRLKACYGARNVTHLATLAISARLHRDKPDVSLPRELSAET